MKINLHASNPNPKIKLNKYCIHKAVNSSALSCDQKLIKCNLWSQTIKAIKQKQLNRQK